MKREKVSKKQKVSKYATLVFIMICAVTLLVGCGKEKNVYPNQQSGSGLETKEKDSKSNLPAEKNDDGNYLDAYYSVVSDFINQYGEYEKDPETSAITGLKYGELIDFERDGVPEMLLVCDRTAYIYRFNGSRAEELLSTPIGSGFGQTDVSYYIYVGNVDGQEYIIVDNTTDEWCEDNWMAYTVREGIVYEIHYLARTDGYNDYPGTEFLTTFTINDESVSSDEYLDNRSALRENARTIDAIWADYSATYDELKAFEASLGR